MDKILVIGSYNVGLTVFGPSIPKAGQTILGNQFDMGPGGKGSNQAICIARLGGKITFLARIGDDIFGKDAMSLFKREGIDTSYINVDSSTSTGAGIIFVDKDCHNAIGVAPGANYKLTPEHIDKAASLFKQTKFLLMQLETPLETVYHAIEKAKKSGCTVILNPAPAQKLDAKYLSMVDILTPNESEAEILTDIPVKDFDGASKAAKALIAQGAKSVIVTMGAQGCLYITSAGEKQFPAYKVKAVDTTGAGDAFNGGLIYALADGKGMDEAIDFASKVAAVSVTSIGCVPGLPTMSDIEKFFAGKGGR
jgi:ribokinase